MEIGRGKVLEFKGFERFWKNEIVIVSGCTKRMNASRWKLER